MLKVYEGDILDRAVFPDVAVVCHQVNTKGVMGGGLALQIRQRYPEVYEEYIKLCEGYGSDGLMGVCQGVRTKDGLYVANLFGQEGYGRGLQTDYRALRTSLEVVRANLDKFEGKVAIPYNLGCGLAGGDWGLVRGILDEVFGETDQVILVWRK